ncbi:uncharacterized protein TM35_000131860 [Trypanosoma theileri]|uniref:Uncharacterized protein n=1 Tax=Trypanosoma theileri TaxID=67003 RepID=A0A1X0NWX6_9TRYP|nr:uncharacterized protein TM35_000131860 [Trypanosoma theileri]ORC89182.1 hypothetical protein TM35_000131860 [Trypanosoma theileri]
MVFLSLLTSFIRKSEVQIFPESYYYVDERGMTTILDDVERDLSILHIELCDAFREETDVVHHHVTQVSNTQSLLYDRHCRRIYRTLSDLCKPEEVVVRAQNITADLWRAWKGIKSASCDATTEMLSRLTSSECKEDAGDENTTLMLLLSIIEDDLSFASETLSLAERGLQQLWKDVECERAVALDVASQRKALRKRQIQRTVAVNLSQETCNRIIEEESSQISTLKSKSRELQIGFKKKRSQRLTGVLLPRVEGEKKTKMLNIFMTSLQQLGMDMKSHEEVQSNLLLKIRSLRDLTVFSNDDQANVYFSQTHERETVQEPSGISITIMSSPEEERISLTQRIDRLQTLLKEFCKPASH